MPLVLSSEADQGTLAALVEAVFTHLEPTSLGILNELAADVTADATTITVTRDTQAAIRAGAYLCVDIEVFYVWAFDEATKTATVKRGMLGSIPAAHNAGALVQIQARNTNFDVLKELRNEIRSWPPGLFRPQTATIGLGSLTRAYDLPMLTGYRVLKARYTGTGTGASSRSAAYELDTNADTAVYPSGNAIIFNNAHANGTVIVTYGAPFVTDPWLLATSLNDIGLTPTMLDIPVLGAASRLLREAPRTDTRAQGQSSTDARVPPGYTGSTRTALRREADTRIHQEIVRLRETYPQRRA